MLLSAQAYDWNSATIKGEGFVTGIVYSEAAANTFYAHTDIGGAYRWDASLNKWMPVTDWTQTTYSNNCGGAQTMAADPTDPNKVYLVVGTYGSTAGFLRSTDGGRTWLRTDVSGIDVDGNGWGRGLGERIAVDPNSPNILFYGAQDWDSSHHGLWKSTDYAASWNQVTNFTNYGDVNDWSYTGAEGVGLPFVIFDKTSGSTGSPTPVIYTASDSIANTATKLYRTTDGGATWSPMPNQPTTTNFPLRAALSADGTVMYVTYGKQAGPLCSGDGDSVIYKITNPSSANPTWTVVGTSTTIVGSNSGIFGPIAIDPTDNNTIYTVTMNSWPSNIFRSTNGGSTWTALNPNNAANRDNSPAPAVSAATLNWITDLEIDPFNHNVAMFNYGGGIWRTTNLTATTPTWTFFVDGLEETAVMDIVSPNTGDVHVFTSMGDCDGFRSADLSVSPPALGQSQSPSLQEGTSDDIDAAWNDANYVVRLTRVSPFVQYSNDNGVTWHWASSTGVTSNSNGGGCVSISADGLYLVYQGSSGTQVVYAIRSGSGSPATWSSWQIPSSNRPAANAKLVADLVAGHTFYAISGSAAYRSTDGGATWTTMTTSNVPGNLNGVRAVPGQTGHLLAACQGSGLYRSTDGGATWTRINSSAVTTANGVGVGMAAPGQNYPAIFIAGTANGVNGFFRSDDQGATWITISDLAHQYNYCGLIQGDPRIYGRVYLSGYGRGLVYGDIHTSPTALSSGWSTQNIGSVGSTGAAGSSSTGSWELTGGGIGISGTTDSFRFAYTTIAGDGSITAQVMDVPSDNPSNHNALAGVMIRSNLTAASASVLMAMTPGSVNGAVFKYRLSNGGATSSANAAGVWNPYWVRLTRSGNTFTAYRSADGITWTQVGSPQTITMGSTVYIGLATTASDNSQVNTSTFQNVSVAATATTLPAAPSSLAAMVVSALYANLSWTDNANNESDFTLERATDSGFTQNLLLTSLGMGITNYSDTSVSPSTSYYYRIRAHNNMGYSAYSNVISCTTLLNTSIFTANQDIGSPSPAGSYSEKSGTYTVNGSGSDIWNNSDQFQYVYKSLSGDGSITARVVNVEDTNGWAKAGVMFRNTLDAGSINALMVLTPDNGASFQYRSSTNGSSSNNNSISYAVPYWVRITRSGNNFSGYISDDGVNWTQIGSTVTLAMNTTVYVGLAVTSHNNGTMCTSIFSNVAVSTPPTVAINQAASQADPANASPINFTLVFSESVSDFATGDVTLSGTAGATTAIVTGNGTTYNVAVSGMTSDGTVIASIAAGVAHDTAGNASVASTSIDNVVAFSTPTHTWDGGSPVNNLWTTKENWVGDVAPSAGDNLIFPAGAAQLVNFNDYPSGTAFGSITVSGSGYHFQGNAYQSSTFEVQTNTNVEVNSIATDTLTIGAGSVVTITPIPGGPLAALMANSALKPLAADALPPNQPETVAQPTAADTITSSSLNAAAIAAGPIAASSVLATLVPATSEVASALASSGSLSNTVLDAVAMPNAIIAETVLPVRLVGSAEERRIDTAFNRPMPQSPMYFRLDSTVLHKDIESGLEQSLAASNENFASAPLLGSLRYELPSSAETIGKHSTTPAINSRQAHIAALQTNSRWSNLDAETDFDIAQHVRAGKKRDKQLDKVVDEVLAEEDAIPALL